MRAVPKLTAMIVLVRRLLVVVALTGSAAHASSDDPPLPPVRATTTVETGDRGGLIFGTKPDPQKTRRFFVAAEPVSWDFAPAGRDEVCGFTFPPGLTAARVREKLRYIQYTDETFSTPVLPQATLGILGPVLRGVVGEYLAVTFLNRTSQPLSMHPHGLRYDKDNEGAYYLRNPGRGAAVGPGARFTYVWELDENSGPRPDEPSSKGWLYHSHVGGDTESNLGLIGCIIVTDPRRARADGTPADVDREFATLFMIFDESGWAATAVSGASSGATTALAWAGEQQRLEAFSRYTINGYTFGNLPALRMNEGDRTRWYLFALGSEQDLHSAHWHGLRVIEDGRRRTDVIELLPASMKVADLLADNPGTWLYHCHVSEHMQEGMFARFEVYARDVVGTDRTPEACFLGLPAAARSARIDRAETVLNLISVPVTQTLTILGAATVPAAFDLAHAAVRLELDGRPVELHPDRHGLAKTGQVTLRIPNVDADGVVRGGLAEFEVNFKGPDWLAAGPSPGTDEERAVPLVLQFGAFRHTAIAAVKARTIQR